MRFGVSVLLRNFENACTHSYNVIVFTEKKLKVTTENAIEKFKILIKCKLDKNLIFKKIQTSYLCTKSFKNTSNYENLTQFLWIRREMHV